MKFVITRASKSVTYTIPYPPPEGAVLEDVGSPVGPLPIIEIDSIDALLEFAEREGEPLVIFPASVDDRIYGKRLPHIEIYDDFIE